MLINTMVFYIINFLSMSYNAIKMKNEY